MLITATAGIVLPSCFTSTSAGAAACRRPRCRDAPPGSATDICRYSHRPPRCSCRTDCRRGGRRRTGPPRRAERHVDDTALDVDREEAPDVDARTVLPAVAAPGVDVLLARARHRLERPDQLPRVHIPGAHVARRSLWRVLLRAAAGDDEVPVHDRRRAEAVAARQALRISGVFSRRCPCRRILVGLAGLRVERDQLVLARAEHDLRRRLGVAGPVFNAARRRTACGQLWKTHTSLPVVGSSATTRPNGEERYITPSTTSGVVSLGANPEPRPRPPRPCGGGLAAAPAGAAGGSPAAQVIHPRHFQLADVRVVICVTGEKRMPPESCP